MLQEVMPKIFSRYRSQVEQQLRNEMRPSRFQRNRNMPLYHLLRYHLGFVDKQGRIQAKALGKALRPTLCLFACEALGGDWLKALPAACAIELVHNFSLIHDDIQDGDLERRHRPTVWSIWGIPQAINAGNAMRDLANIALLDLQKDLPPPKILKAFQILTQASLEMIEGQYLDISYESRLDITIQDYLEMISRKTGALIACSLQLGALLASEDENENEEVISAFRQCGRLLGLAYQIRDDILGIWGDEKSTGKPTNDIIRRKKSLPVVYALEKACGEAQTELLQFYRGSSDKGREGGSANNLAAFHKVLSILEDLNAPLFAQRLAEEKCALALKQLEGIKLPPWAKEELEELADFLLNREQ